jgi:membrane-associated HD superfamily phosphohydrolase
VGPWAVLFCVALTVLLTPGLTLSVKQYQLGQISATTIRASYDFSYEDEVTTESRRSDAAASVLEVYNFKGAAMTDARNRITAGFDYGRAAISSGNEGDGSAQEGDPVELLQRRAAVVTVLQDPLGVTLNDEELDLLGDVRFAPEIEQVLTRVVTAVLSRDIVASKERLLASGRPIDRWDEVTKATQTRRDFSAVLSTEEARELLVVQMANLSDLREPERRKLSGLGSRFIEPTLTFDFAETERRRAVAREDVDPVYIVVRKGKTIVRAGDEITDNVVEQLDYLAGEQNRRWGFAGAFGALVLAVLLLVIQWQWLRPARIGEAWRRQSYAMVGIIVIGHLALTRVGFFVARVFSEQVVTAPFNNTASYFYAMPFASVAVLILMLEHTPTSLLASTLFSIAIGVMTGNLQLASFALISCLAAILGLFQYKRRTALFTLGLLVGSVNFVVVLAFDLLTGRYFPRTLLALTCCAPFSGVPAFR